MIAYSLRRSAPRPSILAATLIALTAPASAEGDPAAYLAAVPMLERAGGGKACVSCFLERYAPAEFNKAFAVSPDGAYGGRWHNQSSLEQVRERALENCQKKPEFNPAHPCVIFFENDRLVWQP